MDEPQEKSPYPPDCRFEVLDANLATLEQRSSGLPERIRRAAGSRHVTAPDDDPGALFYNLGVYHFALPLEREEAERGLADDVPEGTEPRRLLVFGLGLGEQLELVLRRFPRARVVAWERDPWLLRLVLMRRDWSPWIRSGRLQFILGMDLLDEIPHRARTTVVAHPRLRRAYAVERRTYADGLGPRRALVRLGVLYMESLASSLRRAGYSVMSIDLENCAPEELDAGVRRFQPELLGSINYVDGLVEFCDRHGLKFLGWEIDPTVLPLWPVDVSTDRARIYTYRRARVDVFRQAGFRHVEHLPLAADTELRHPLELGEEDRERYGAPVAFVGNSMVTNVANCRRFFLDLYEMWGQGGTREDGNRALIATLDEQRADMSRWCFLELFEKRAPGFFAWCRDRTGAVDPRVLAGEIAASEKRLSYAANLGRLGLPVWGDPGWNIVKRYAVRYRGPAAHHRELTAIYNAAAIQLDISRFYQADIVPMRVFDMLACGAFALVEHSPDLEEVFDVGTEIVSYRDLSDLMAKVRHYRDHPAEARALAERGHRAVLERHSFDTRVAYMLASFEEEPARGAVQGPGLRASPRTAQAVPQSSETG